MRDVRELSDGDLWQHAPCGLLVAAVDGVILRANDTFCRMLGYPCAELIGIKRFQDLLPMGARMYLQTHWLPLLDLQGAVAEIQMDMLHRGGGRAPVLLSATRRRIDGGFHDEIAVLTAADRKLYEKELLDSRSAARAALDELKQAKAELRRANQELSNGHRLKDEFLATLAHELRNPLAPVANVVEVLRLGGFNAERSEWAAKILARQVAQMSHLVDDLLDAARINLGKIELRLARVGLADVLVQAVESASSAIELKGQSLRTAISHEPMPVNADVTRVTQVVVNLLNNASKYSPGGAVIELLASIESGWAVIEVRDNGMGIASGQLSRIFDMFSQVTPTVDRTQGGLGIGLALVQKLVDLHGGSVEAHSPGVGKGSSFFVRLPLAAEPAAAESTPASPFPDTQGPGVRLVIVDDNVDSAETLSMALELFGHQARTAHDGAGALSVIDTFRPDVAVLDIGLPDMNGYEVARRVRATGWGSGMLLIALTGWGQDADRQAASAAGFDAHLTKPVDFLKLNEEISRLIGGGKPGVD